MKSAFASLSSVALAALGLSLVPTTGCSGSTIPIGQNGDAEPGGSSSSGGSSGASTSSGASSSSSGGSGSSGAISSSSGGTGLQWYWTCGDPVCRAPSSDAGGGLTNDAGVPCPAVGTGCSVAGERCGTRDPNFQCGANEECAASDPTHGKYGCPISSRKYKDGIAYVDNAGLEKLHDETLALRLATYRYKPEAADPNQQHLGFIIEDTPPGSSAVQSSRERVDLYGYMSMIVATIKVQEKEISELRRELAAAQSSTCR